MHLALEDAGLKLERLPRPGSRGHHPDCYPQPFWPEEVVEILGITPGFLLGGVCVSGAVSLLGAMAAAMSSGLIDIALVIGAARRLFRNISAVASSPADMRDWEIPYGTMGPNSKIAMVMRRYMHQYGATLDHFGKIAVAGRYHASLKPAGIPAQTHRQVEGYRESRLVADPVRLLDCVMPANGGRAYILASPKRAKTLQQEKPVYLKGFGERSNPSYGPRAGSDPVIMGVKDAGKVAMEMAGVKHGDINFLATLQQLRSSSFTCRSNISAFVPRVM